MRAEEALKRLGLLLVLLLGTAPTPWCRSRPVIDRPMHGVVPAAITGSRRDPHGGTRGAAAPQRCRADRRHPGAAQPGLAPIGVDAGAARNIGLGLAQRSGAGVLAAGQILDAPG
jgi:hypothetical protein